MADPHIHTISVHQPKLWCSHTAHYPLTQCCPPTKTVVQSHSTLPINPMLRVCQVDFTLGLYPRTPVTRVIPLTWPWLCLRVSTAFLWHTERRRLASCLYTPQMVSACRICNGKLEQQQRGSVMTSAWYGHRNLRWVLTGTSMLKNLLWATSDWVAAWSFYCQYRPDHHTVINNIQYNII